MKWLACLFLTSVCLAQTVKCVLVLTDSYTPACVPPSALIPPVNPTPPAVAVTPTQVVITYAAPDTSACVVDVREQASGLLVHDVDPALFLGADSDSRSGNLGAGVTARTAVVGHRTAEKASDGKYYSRALQAKTPHTYKVTCKGAVTVSGTFTTANIMPTTWNDPYAADQTTPGAYAWPTLDPANASQQIIDQHTGSLIMPFQTHADGSYVQWVATPALNLCSQVQQRTPAGESGVLCSQWPDVWFAGDKGVRHIDMMQCVNPQWDGTDPNTAQCIGSVGIGWNNIATYKYQGDFSTNTSQSGCGCSALSVSTVTVGGIFAQAGVSGLAVLAPTAYVNGNWYFYGMRSAQDSWGNLVVWNEQNNKVMANSSTIKHSNMPCRWCSLHNTFVTPDGKYYGFYSDDLKGDPTRPGYGPYVSHAVSGSIPGDPPIECGGALGVTGKQCTLIPVDGEPVNPKPNGDDTASMQPAIPGDMVGFEIYNGNSYEFGRLLDKGTDGKTWLIQRGWPYFGTGSFYPGWMRAHADPSIFMVCGDKSGIPSGSNPPNPGGGGLAWDWQSDGTGETGWTLAAFQGQHGSMNSNMIVQPFYSLRTGELSVAFKKNVPDYQVNGNPPWHGVTGVGWPMASDTHPAPPDANNLMPDGHPAFFADNMPTGTNLAGTLWKYAPTPSQYDPKHLSTFAYCTDKVLVDISGPSSAITSNVTDMNKSCFAHKAGECVQQSQAGELYINCAGGANFGNNGGRFGSIVETDMSASNANGTRSRILTHGFGIYGHQDSFWSGTPIGPGWLAFSVPVPNNGAISQQIYMVKRLPMPADDGVNRSDYQTFSVAIQPPAGTSDVVVQFGYDQTYACTSRKEACIKGAQPGNEFDFASDIVTGVPPTATSISIPVISQRVLYYQVLYRNPAGKTSNTGAPMVTVTP